MADNSLDMARPSGLKVTVMGLGLNGGGLESARYFASRGAIVTVTDSRGEDILKPSIDALEGLPLRYVLGRHEMEDFTTADLVIKNPSVPPDSPFIAAARRIETDISVFLGLSRSPLIAVTGSKGKSTTASAIHHGFVEAGIPALLGGNITISPLTFLENTGPDVPVVLELSSWQLADLRGKGLPRPKIALLTSIMPDHMNRYKTMEDYVADKRIIYASQDASMITICNADDVWGESFASATKAEVLRYSSQKTDIKGAWLEPAEPGSRMPRRGYFRPSKDAEARFILPRELFVVGGHQRKNLLAAGCALAAMGVDADDIARGLAGFRGVEHRMEFFAESEGVRWYNDSAATIPQAVVAALESFDSPPVLITGGTDKNIDFKPVANGYAKAGAIVLLAGTGTDKLRPLLDQAGIATLGPYTDIESAVAQARALAKPGDGVILSPGCTSFGMFLHEFDRGAKFKAAVRHELGFQASMESSHPILEEKKDRL